MRSMIVAAVLFAGSPASAQLTPEAYTWGAEIHSNGRTTVIVARKAGAHWSVEMMCERRIGRKTETKRWQGQARWLAPGYMHAFMDGGVKVSVIPNEDGVSVMASPGVCASGPGMLTSGGG